MAGPSPAFLEQLNAGLSANPFDAGAEAAGISPPLAVPPQPSPAPAPSLSGLADVFDPRRFAAAPPTAPTMLDGNDAASTAAPPIAGPGMPPPPQGPSGPPAPPPSPPSPVTAPEPMPPDVQFRPVGGGATPAGERATRGPIQNELLDASFQPEQDAAGRVQLRSAIEAQHASDFYEQQAERYQQQQDAFERVQARRQQELEQLRSRYENTIADLGKAQVDSNRLWANMSTGDKIGATILVMIGSVFGGADRGIKMLDDRIRADVEEQKFNYQKGLDLAKAQQSAYAQAIEQYGSEDAAYHIAMSAGQLAAAAKAQAIAAQWKGTDSANQADMLRAGLQANAFKSAAEGFKFVPAGVAAQKYQMMIRGQAVPGLVDEKRAQDYAVEHGVKPAERVDEKLVEGGIQSKLLDQKSAAETSKNTAQRGVVLPNGEQIAARDDKEKEKLQTLSTAVTSAQDLVREAKQLRKGDSWRIPGSKDRRRLEAIQAELTLAFKDRGGLGALSGPDMDLAASATGDMTSQMPNADAKLDSFSAHTLNALRSYVRTIPGAPPKSAGVMPGSFQPAAK